MKGFSSKKQITQQKTLGKFKHWKTKMHTVYRNKNSGFVGVATLILNICQKCIQRRINKLQFRVSME